MFAVLVQEREPFKLDDLPFAFYTWVQGVGGFCLVGLIIWGIVRLASPRRAQSEGLNFFGGRRWLVVGAVWLAILAAAFLPAKAAEKAGRTWQTKDVGKPGYISGNPQETEYFDSAPDSPRQLAWLLVTSFCLAAVIVPFAANLGQLRWRRIWALAQLSYKEAVRKKILWVFSILVLASLVAGWFLPYKPEDQVRTYVDFVYLVMTLLLLLTAALLASFSLPADLRSQNIHTIVTKPVERFEIILGRFLGFTLLMTAVLVVMTLFSLIYVARGVEAEAAYESLRARVPIYGDLKVQTIKEGKPVQEGKSVGREWEYRAYISGGKNVDEYAQWNFPQLPRDFANRDTVRLEFAFDIFRTSKGDVENKGLLCDFVLENPKWLARHPDSKRTDKDYQDAVERAKRSADPGLLARAQEENWSPEKIEAMELNPVAAEFGRFELNSKEVVDYHTLFLEVPAGLFKDLAEGDQGKADQLPALRLTVWCQDNTQLLGVAKYDLYLLDTERSPYLNFFKASMGLWFQLCLVIGLAVTCSTYLSGVISLLVVAFLYVVGLALEFIKNIAAGKAVGGGPLESLIRLGSGTNMIAPLDATPPTMAAMMADRAFREALKSVLNIFPDVNRFDLTNYVAEGFNISFVQLASTGLLLAGYLLPWLVLAYYLMKTREVAA